MPRTDPNIAAPSRLAVAFLLLAPAVLATAACKPNPADQPAAQPTVYGTDAAAVSTDWTVENPTEPAVPVVLPTTRMTNAPVPSPAATRP